MAGIPDKELLDQLNAFTRSVIELWDWEELAALGEQRHIEHRGPESNLLTFSVQVLENEELRDRRYLNVSVSVSDFRAGKDLGSAYMPLSNNFIYFRDGELDLEFKEDFAPNA